MTNVSDSVLQRVFGKGSFIKIVDALLDHPNYEYTKKELAEVNGMSRATLYRVWDRVEDLEIVEESRKIGNTTMFKLNTESPVVKALYQFEQTIRDLDNKTADEGGNQ